MNKQYTSWQVRQKTAEPGRLVWIVLLLLQSVRPAFETGEVKG